MQHEVESGVLAMSGGSTIGRYTAIEYAIPVGDRVVRLLGPEHPHAIRREEQAEERFLADGYMPYWATPWPGARMLAEYLIANLPVGQRPVLELGAGLGLVGIALAMTGQRMVVTDYDEDALAFVQASAALNQVSLQEVRAVDWRRPLPERFSTIVAGDVLYEKRHHEPIAELIAGGLEVGGTAYLSDPNRAAAEPFPGVAEAHGLTLAKTEVRCQAIPRPDATDGRVFKGAVYRIQRRGCTPGW